MRPDLLEATFVVTSITTVTSVPHSKILAYKYSTNIQDINCYALDFEFIAIHSFVECENVIMEELECKNYLT